MNASSLQTQLTEYKTAFIARVDPARVATIKSATEQLRASGIEATALKVGQPAPDVEPPCGIVFPAE